MLSKLPGWVVDDVTSVREEAEQWIGTTASERWRLARLCSRDAMWAARASGDPRRILDHVDPLPETTVVALARPAKGGLGRWESLSVAQPKLPSASPTHWRQPACPTRSVEPSRWPSQESRAAPPTWTSNVFVPESRVPEAIDVLVALGIDIDALSALARAQRDGMFVGRWDSMRIDVFLPSIPFSLEAERTRILVTDETGWSGWFLAAEALAVFKLLFFRGKDLVDLERLLAVRRELDREYVRRWIVEMMGEDDERTRKWDELVRRFGS